MNVSSGTSHPDSPGQKAIKHVPVVVVLVAAAAAAAVALMYFVRLSHPYVTSCHTFATHYLLLQ